MYINFSPLTDLTQKKAQFGFIMGDQTFSQDLLDSFFSTRHGAVLQNAGLPPDVLSRFLSNYFGAHLAAVSIAREISRIPPTPENEIRLAHLYKELDDLNNLKRKLLVEYGIPKEVWENYVEALRREMPLNPRRQLEDFFHPFAPLNYPKTTE
jgi:hypothetical protein